MKISWGNHVDIDDIAPKNGYGYATERIISSLRHLGHEVTYQDPTADVHFHFDQPHHLKVPKEGMYTIAYHPWESTQLKKGWSEILNGCDEVWTPSHLIAGWYQEHNNITKPIYVFEHGVDKIWEPKKRIHESDTFEILHVGGEAVRRGMADAMKAVRMAFPRNIDVRLNLKMIARGINIKQPRLNILNDKLSIEELINLYHGNHVMLGISYGEGFGLTPLQGLATAMPVISQPAWAPYKDFLDPDLTIGSRRVRSPWKAIHPGVMLQPDMGDIIERLRFAYNNFEAVSNRAVELSEKVKEFYDWNRLTEEAFSALEKRI